MHLTWTHLRIDRSEATVQSLRSAQPSEIKRSRRPDLKNLEQARAMHDWFPLHCRTPDEMEKYSTPTVYTLLSTQ